MPSNQAGLLHRAAQALILAILFMLFLAGSAFPSRADQLRYLAFQMFTGSPSFGQNQPDCGLSDMPDRAEIDRFVADLLDRIGTNGDGQQRLAVIIGPLTWDHSDAQLDELITDLFSVARARDVAVGLHIDDGKFWSCRTELLADPGNVERVGWQADPSTGQYLDWGSPMQLAPQMCVGSIAIQFEARRRASRVIGSALARELARTEDDLFAGVIAGWETAMGLDVETQLTTGYCTLAALGYSAETPPENRAQVLETAMQDWIGLWTGALAETGVSADKIYSHIAFIPESDYDRLAQRQGQAATYSEFSGYTPAPTAFGPTHRPGFSTYPNVRGFQEIHSLTLADGGGWASAEGANVMLTPDGGQEPDEGMETYLAYMFNHGATLTTLFGWGLGAPGGVFTSSVESPTSLAAYRKFLSGAPLDEIPLENAYQPANGLPQRIERMQSCIETYRTTGDMQELTQLLQSLDAQVKADEYAAAQVQTEEIIALVCP